MQLNVNYVLFKCYFDVKTCKFSIKGILKLVLTYIFSTRAKVVSFQFNCKTLRAHIIPNIVKISLKRVEMNFCPGIKNSIIRKNPRKPQDMTELSTNYVTYTKFH